MSTHIKREHDQKEESSKSNPGVISTEIERKFLVEAIPDLNKLENEEIIQGYISTASDCSEVRVRQKGEKFYQTIKGEGDLARTEIEIEISREQFDSLWATTEGKRLEKVRYYVPYEGEIIELDVYQGGLKGLVVAEVEFTSEKQSELFIPPAWLGREVTEDEDYKNKQLAMKGMPSKSRSD